MSRVRTETLDTLIQDFDLKVKEYNDAWQEYRDAMEQLELTIGMKVQNAKKKIRNPVTRGERVAKDFLSKVIGADVEKIDNITHCGNLEYHMSNNNKRYYVDLKQLTESENPADYDVVEETDRYNGTHYCLKLKTDNELFMNNL